MSKKTILLALFSVIWLIGCKHNIIATMEENIKVINESSLIIDSIATFDLIDGQRKAFKIKSFDQNVLSTRNNSIRSTNSRFQLIDNNGKVLFDTIPKISYPDQMYKHSSGEPIKEIDMTTEFIISEVTEQGITMNRLSLRSSYYWLFRTN